MLSTAMQVRSGSHRVASSSALTLRLYSSFSAAGVVSTVELNPVVPMFDCFGIVVDSASGLLFATALARETEKSSEAGVYAIDPAGN